MTFSSSRTLPGQSYSCSRSSASAVSSRWVFWFSLPYFSRKVWTSSGMSSLRSRSGRQLHGDDVEAVEQVLAELAFVHHVAQIDVGRGDDPDVDLDRLDAAKAHELALLDDAQQLGLRLERDVADLVEEDRPLVGELEQPLLRVDGAGESALDVAEQVRLEQVGRQVAGVDGDERAIRPRGVLVQRPRDQLLAGTAFAVDQDGGAARRGLDDQVEDLPHARAPADDLAEAVRARLEILPSARFSATSRRCASALRSTTSTSSFLNGLVM